MGAVSHFLTDRPLGGNFTYKVASPYAKILHDWQNEHWSKSSADAP